MTKPLAKNIAEIAAPEIIAALTLPDGWLEVLAWLAVGFLLICVLLPIYGHLRGKFNWRTGEWYRKGKRIKRRRV